MNGIIRPLSASEWKRGHAKAAGRYSTGGAGSGVAGVRKPKRDAIPAGSRGANPGKQGSRILTPEAKTLKAVLKFLEWHPMVAWVARFNVGAVRFGFDRFVRFGPKGFPDIHGFTKGGRALYLECKAAKGRVTDRQAAFLETAKASGCIAGVVRSVEDAERLLHG